MRDAQGPPGWAHRRAHRSLSAARAPGSGMDAALSLRRPRWACHAVVRYPRAVARLCRGRGVLCRAGRGHRATVGHNPLARRRSGDWWPPRTQRNVCRDEASAHPAFVSPRPGPPDGAYGLANCPTLVANADGRSARSFPPTLAPPLSAGAAPGPHTQWEASSP